MGDVDDRLHPVSVGGVLALAIGAGLPELRLESARMKGLPIETIDPAWTQPGFARFDLAVLTLGAVALAVERYGSRDSIRAPGLLGAGLGSGWVCFDALQVSSRSVGMSITYVPATGWYLVAVGSVLLVVVAIVTLAHRWKSHWLTVGGLLGLVAGAYLPWLRVDPTVDPPFYTKLPAPPAGLHPGFQGLDAYLLGGVAFVALLAWARPGGVLPALAAIVVGAFALDLVLSYPASTSAGVFLSSGPYIYAVGRWVTAVSAGALLTGGGWQILSLLFASRNRLPDWFPDTTMH